MMTLPSCQVCICTVTVNVAIRPHQAGPREHPISIAIDVDSCEYKLHGPTGPAAVYVSLLLRL